MTTAKELIEYLNQFPKDYKLKFGNDFEWFNLEKDDMKLSNKTIQIKTTQEDKCLYCDGYCEYKNRPGCLCDECEYY